MIGVLELQQYLETVKVRMESVNFVRTLIDETDINKDMEKRSVKRDRHMIYAVIPETDAIGSNDSLRDKNYVGFMILEKTDYSATSAHDKWLKLFDDTQKTTIAFRKILLSDKEEAYESCEFLRFLESKTIHIEPVKWLSNCNGWMLTVDIINDF